MKLWDLISTFPIMMERINNEGTPGQEGIALLQVFSGSSIRKGFQMSFSILLLYKGRRKN